MKIGLIDCDFRNGNTFPNLALMKISAYHKSRGNSVEWYMPFSDRYDIVYVSKVFTFTPDYDFSINADHIIYGGTGYQIQLINGKEVFVGNNTDFDEKLTDRIPVYYLDLPQEIEHIYPDYELYPNLCKDTAYGFLTRGCPRGCSFCHVAAKEGKKSVKVADLSEFWNGQSNIVLMDPNILACKDRKELLMQLANSNARVDFNQGLDARMLDPEICNMISNIKIKSIHFAWDRYQDGDIILPKLKMFFEFNYTGKKKGHDATVYTLVNFDTTLEQDLERIYTLRDMGYWAYVMIYDKEHSSKDHKRLQRWCNNRYIFTSCASFNDYKG